MRVLWTPRSVQDLARIVRFIAADKPEAASRTGERIFDAVMALQNSPARGRLGIVAGTRELVMTFAPYIAVYRIKDEEIRVLLVRHAARQWPPAG